MRSVGDVCVLVAEAMLWPDGPRCEVVFSAPGGPQRRPTRWFGVGVTWVWNLRGADTALGGHRRGSVRRRPLGGGSDGLTWCAPLALRPLGPGAHGPWHVVDGPPHYPPGPPVDGHTVPFGGHPFQTQYYGAPQHHHEPNVLEDRVRRVSVLGCASVPASCAGQPRCTTNLGFV